MMLLIKGAYKDFIREKQKRRADVSLDEFTNGVFRLLDILKGDDDIIIEEEINPDELENSVTNPKLRKAIKPLTKKEKSAVYFCAILEESGPVAGAKLNYKDPSSAKKLSNKAVKKIKKKIDKLGGLNDD